MSFQRLLFSWLTHFSHWRWSSLCPPPHPPGLLQAKKRCLGWGEALCKFQGPQRCMLQWTARCLPSMLQDTVVLSFQKPPSVHARVVASSHFHDVCREETQQTLINSPSLRKTGTLYSSEGHRDPSRDTELSLEAAKRPTY